MSTSATAEQALVAESLLAGLPDESLAAVSRHLEPVALGHQQTLYEIGDRVAYAYFPAGGCVLTSVAIMSDGATVETAMVGREAAAGLVALLAGRPTRYWTRALLPGEALRLRAEALQELFERDEAARRLLLGCYRGLLYQATRRAVCNARHHLFERLSTWLLMLRERAGGDDLPLTQEAVSRQLGVRRAGVNEAVGRLERAGAVEHSRGRLHVEDVGLLEVAACRCHRSLRAGARGPGVG
ncbi:MAG TPA: Crp/Fnr family transcriptional regulator [Pyrinomonadaceae bacterium]|nr:Crp/Fnr family transcriptional regulator [Pyrinomonadaceae bacterium]